MVQISPGPLQPASGDVNRNISNCTDPLPHLYSHVHQNSQSLSLPIISGIRHGVMYVTEEKTGLYSPLIFPGVQCPWSHWRVGNHPLTEPCLLGCKLSGYHIRVLLPPNPKWPEESPSLLPFLHPDYSGAICCFLCRSLGLAHPRHSLSSFTWNTRKDSWASHLKELLSAVPSLSPSRSTQMVFMLGNQAQRQDSSKFSRSPSLPLYLPWVLRHKLVTHFPTLQTKLGEWNPGVYWGHILHLQ